MKSYRANYTVLAAKITRIIKLEKSYIVKYEGGEIEVDVWWIWAAGARVGHYLVFDARGKTVKESYYFEKFYILDQKPVIGWASRLSGWAMSALQIFIIAYFLIDFYFNVIVGF